MARSLAKKPREILNHLRQQIVKGIYKPGTRLPTRRELEKSLGTGRNTVQRALHVLREEGFVRPHGCNGTFVCDYPPHLFRYALVFANDMATSSQWGRFEESVYQAAKLYDQDMPITFRVVFANAQDSAMNWDRVAEEAQTHRIAGAIFVRMQLPLSATPLARRDDLPVVSIEVGPKEPFLVPDQADFISRALDELISRGSRRIGFLHVGGHIRYEQFCSVVAPLMQERELLLHREWAQAVHWGSDDWVQNILQMWMNGDENNCPNGLVIMDDNLVPAVTTALREMKIRVPEDLAVVGHATFPSPSPANVPIKRIGFSADEIIVRAVDCLRRQQHGETMTGCHKILTYRSGDSARFRRSHKHEVREWAEKMQ